MNSTHFVSPLKSGLLVTFCFLANSACIRTKTIDTGSDTVGAAPPASAQANFCKGAGSRETQRLCDHYLANHSSIVRDAKAEYKAWGIEGGPCAMTLSFALKRSGAAVQREYIPQTQRLTQELSRQGWNRVTCDALLPGDVVFTVADAKLRADKAEIPYHSYMFVDWVPGLGKTRAYATDYKNRVYSRYAIAPKKPSPEQVAASRESHDRPGVTFYGYHLCAYGMRGPTPK